MPCVRHGVHDNRGPDAHTFRHGNPLPDVGSLRVGLGSESTQAAKFLVDAQGEVVGRYGSVDTPEKIEKDVLKLI